MVDYKFKRKPRGTHCSKGHEFTEENTFTRAYDNARVCRECRKQYAREKYQRNKDKNGGIARLKKDKQPAFELFDSMSPEAEEKWRALQHGLELHTTPCAGKPEYYADKSIEVTIDKAEEMCYNCPLIKQCYDYAVADNVTAGIWGGIHFDQDEGELFDEFDIKPN
jgi:hypothetical protein